MINEVVQTMLNVGGKATYLSDMNAVSVAAKAAGHSMDLATRASSMLGVGLAGLVGGLTLSSVAAIGSEFENTQLKMAGTLTALGFASDYMNEGLSMAASTMTQIKAAAAALPGEAQDYVAVFSATLPNVQAAVGGTMNDMTKFTNQLTAIGSTFGIDSMQIAGDLNRMLAARGGAGADVRTFQQLVPFMRTLEGQANLTAESFNKMTQTKRAEILKGTFASFGPMLEQAANSWDAIMGTTKGVAGEIWRMGTAPIFEIMKTSLASINSQLMDGEGNLIGWGAQLARIGEVLSMGVAGTIRMIPTWIDIAREKLEQFSSVLQSMPILGAILDLGGGENFLQTVGANLGGSLDKVGAMFSRLSELIGPILELYGTYQAILYTVLLPATDGIANGLYLVVDALVGALLPILDQVTNTLVDSVFPVLADLGNAIGDTISALGEFLGPLITLTGAFFGKAF